MKNSSPVTWKTFRFPGKYAYLLAFALMMLFNNCKKEDILEDSFYSLDSVIDIEGNEYKIVSLFGQTWMAENLKTTTLNEGTPIIEAADSAAWTTTTSAAYCWYNNDSLAYKKNYGALYNWYTVKTEKLCPKGWRVPNEIDWELLVDSLKGQAVAGGKLKHAGSEFWRATNAGATNSSGFRALPGGYRNLAGNFKYLGDYGYWWSALNYDGKKAWYHNLFYYSPRVYRNYFDLNMGFSVRCIKNTNKSN